jgi:DNA-3-methyladenine glycosylase I
MTVKERCSWCGTDPLYVDYHDHEWGRPVYGSVDLFERLTLEGMQAGLSWFTILKKRDHMTEVFLGFDPVQLHEQGPGLMDAWLADAGIIRHRGKLEAMVNNAGLCVEMGNDFSDFLWSFVDGEPLQNSLSSLHNVPAQTAESGAMSKALKKRGFKFVGPTTCYAFMQSVGMVNDHLISCPEYSTCRDLIAR